MSMKPVGCCPPGQIVTDVDLGTCGCAPGGSSGAGMCPKGDMEAFKQAVDLTEKHEEIIDCYRRAFRFYTEIKGRIELSFALGPQGQVLPLGPGSSELHTSPVQTCIHRVLRQTRFSPPLDGYAEIKLPLVFE